MTSRRKAQLTAAAATLSLGLAAWSPAANTTWTGPAAGNWNVSANWNNGVPTAGNNTFVDAGAAANVAVSVTDSASTGTLIISAGDRVSVPATVAPLSFTLGRLTNSGTLDVDGSTLTLASTITNSGALVLGSSLAGGTFVFNTATLTGGGSMVLNRSASFSPLVTGTGTFANLNNTISGAASFEGSNFRLRNAGTIVASSSLGPISIKPAGTLNAVNSGTLIADGGTLILDGAAGGSISNSVGTLIAGSTDILLTNNISIQGGRTYSSGTGVIRVPAGHTASLGLPEINGTLTIAGSVLGSGTFYNRGSVNIISSNGGTAAISSSSFSAFQFSGTVNMISTSAHRSTISSAGELIVSGNTIRGDGIISAARLSSSGTLRADIATSTLLINNGSLTTLISSFGTWAASSGGILHLSGSGTNAASTGTIAVNDASSTFMVTMPTRTLAANRILNAGLVSIRDHSTVTLNTLHGDGVLEIGTSSLVSFNQGTASAGASRLGSLLIDGTSALDINDQDIVYDYSGASPIDAVRSLIASGFAGGSWNGNGIRTSAAATDRAVGYAEASDALPGAGTFGGQSLDGTTLLIRYTLTGDANLDRAVNIADFSSLAANFNQPSDWFNGDFNFDGTTGIADFSLLAANFNKVLTAGDLPRGPAVPEPGAAGVVVLALAASRRRASRR